MNKNKLNLKKNFTDPNDPNTIESVLIEVNASPFPNPLVFAVVDSGMLIIFIFLYFFKLNNK